MPTNELVSINKTYAHLQSLVIACGVRKVWVKEFKGLDQPSQQIARLRDILKDLGMSGRMSMEQAKSIKQKRELEQELRGLFVAACVCLSSWALQMMCRTSIRKLSRDHLEAGAQRRRKTRQLRKAKARMEMRMKMRKAKRRLRGGGRFALCL
jgi:hypothetical protein